MSSDSLAIFRKSLGPELDALAEQHLQHDLNETDRNTLKQASKTITLHAAIGSTLGLSLGLLLATRIRAARARTLATFRAAEQPISLRFANGREENLPDIRPLMRPSKIGDVLAFSLLGLGGVFFGGEVGLLTGTFRARQTIGYDREGRERIQGAFRAFRADALRRKAQLIEEGKEGEWGF